MNGRVTQILNADKRSGTNKNGKPYTIMEIEVEKDDGALVHADTFDTVVDGDIVDLQPTSYTNPKTNKTYHGFNASLPKKPKSQAGANDDAILLAVRMVYREVRDANRKLDMLIGPEDDVTAGAPVETGEPPIDEGVDDTEPHVEPVPEEPGDLSDFMNAS